MDKIGYTYDEILEFMTEGEGRGFLGRSMYDAIRETIEEKDKEIERLKEKLERINCLIHKAINEREINGVANLNLHEILELSGSDDNG